MTTNADNNSDKIELGPKLFSFVVKVLEDPTGKTTHPNVAFGGKNASQKLNIVGESFYQDALSRFKVGVSYGFLVPDQNNPYDKNAVALYLIDEDLMIHRVGHLPKEVAAKVSQSIANILGSNNQIIPVQARVAGGTKEKPTLGVFAYARTSVINFG
jgi:hypothetical protein